MSSPWVRFTGILLAWVFLTPVFYFCTLFQWMGSDFFQIQLAGAALSLGFFIIGSMSLVSLIVTYTTEPGLVRLAIKSLPEATVIRMNECYQCHEPKPDRAHHSRRLDACYLRMDHFCHSLGIVIALRNHKPFVAMLAWWVIQCFYSLAIGLANCFVNKPDPFVVICIITHVILLITIGASLVDQLLLIARNMTLTEKHQKNIGRYDRGVSANFDEFFGPGIPVLRALIPTPTTLTGLEWELARQNHY